MHKAAVSVIIPIIRSNACSLLYVIIPIIRSNACSLLYVRSGLLPLPLIYRAKPWSAYTAYGPTCINIWSVFSCNGLWQRQTNAYEAYLGNKFGEPTAGITMTQSQWERSKESEITAWPCKHRNYDLLLFLTLTLNHRKMATNWKRHHHCMESLKCSALQQKCTA